MSSYSVCHLTSVHSPDDIRIFQKECRSLARAGYDVTLIAPADTGKEFEEKLRLVAVPIPGSRNERMTKTVWQVYRAALDVDADVYHFHDSELIPIALLLKVRGYKVVYDVHEDLPRQVLSKHWIPRWVRWLVSWTMSFTEAICVRFFDGVVAATPSIGRRFSSRKMVIVQNYPLLGELSSPGSTPFKERPPWVAYVGGISAIRGVKEMVGAMDLLEGPDEVQLILAGRFSPQSLEKEVSRTSGWARVAFRGHQSRAQVRDLLGQSRVGLVLFHPEPNHIESQPNKLFEYMSAGLPVLCSEFPLWKELVESVGCGITVNPLDSKAIARRVRWLLDHPDESAEMGARGKEAVFQRFNWSVEEQTLIQFYEGITR